MLTTTSKLLLVVVDSLALLLVISGILASITHNYKFVRIFIRYFIPSILLFTFGKFVMLGYFDSDPQKMIIVLLMIEILHYLSDADRFKISYSKRNRRFNEDSRKDYRTETLPSKEELKDEDDKLQEAIRIINKTGYNQGNIARQIRETGKVDGHWVVGEDLRKYFQTGNVSTTGLSDVTPVESKSDLEETTESEEVQHEQQDIPTEKQD